MTQHIHYRRNLPHYHPDGFPLFVTFRLAGSLPVSILTELRMQRECELKALKKSTQEQKSVFEQKHFEHYDNWLDRCEYGPRWLQIDKIAQIVMDEVEILASDRYFLIADCIMPNHVHLLIRSLIGNAANHQGTSANYPVTDTLRLLKGRTARYCNLVLQRSGSFWQHESYDHVVRDEQELERTILYIMNNPVKAGLVKEWKDWRFVYVNPDLGDW